MPLLLKMLKFSFFQTHPAFEPTYQVPDSLRLEIKQSLENQLLEAGKQLQAQSYTA